MSVHLSPIGNAFQFFNTNGRPLSLGSLYTYAAGTSTPQTTYSDSGGISANANPILLDASGRVPSEVWLTDGSAYKFVLKDAGGSTLGTYDNLSGIGDRTGLATLAALAATAAPEGSSLVGFKQTITGAVARTVQSKLQDVVSLQDFGAVGDGATDNVAAMQAALTYLGATGGEILIPAGVFVFSSRISLTSNITLRGLSNGSSIIKNTAGSSPNNIAIDVRGAVGSAYPINATTEGQSSVTTTTAGNAGNFVAGDFIALAGPLTTGDYYPFFVTTVVSANAGTGVIALTDKVRRTGGYTQVLKVTTLVQNVTIRDLQISQAGDAAVFVKYARNVTVKNLVDTRVTAAVGISTVGSRNMAIRDNRFAVAMGFHSTVDSLVENNVSFGSLQTALEGGCEYMTMVGNRLAGMTSNGFGSQTQSQRNQYIGNTIVNVPDLGVGIQMLSDAGFGGGNVVVGNVITGGGVGDFGIAIGSGSNGNTVAGNVIVGFDVGLTTSDSGLALGQNKFISCTADITTPSGAVDGYREVSGISGTATQAKNLRGSATFTGAATKAVAFPTAEPDTAYFLGICGSLGETFWVTAKTVNGFTLNSSNATSIATVDWHLIR